MAELGGRGVGQMVDQLNEAKRQIEEAKDQIDDGMEAGLKDTAEDLEGEMKSNLKKNGSVNTGRLKNSITARPGKEGWKVGPRGVDYAKYVEYGTSPHTITPDGLSMADIEGLAAESRELGMLSPDTLDAPSLQIDGEHAFWAQHPGSKAKPFFRPAVNEARENDWLIENIEEYTMPILREALE